MALFQRRPQQGQVSSLYTIGLNKDLLIIGLGNMGKKFELTRHNIGFVCLDDFALKSEFPSWLNKTDLKSQITVFNLGDSRVILAKPTTMMNLSGNAVEALIHFYKIPLQHLLIVHDELDIPFGQIRTRVDGSDAGHNGIKSIITKIGEDFGRVRIGIGPKTPEQIDSSDFVLQEFNSEQQEQVSLLKNEVSALINEWIFSGQNLPHETRNFLLS